MYELLFMYKFLYELLYSILLDTNLGVELLGLTVMPCLLFEEPKTSYNSSRASFVCFFKKIFFYCGKKHIS